MRQIYIHVPNVRPFLLEKRIHNIDSIFSYSFLTTEALDLFYMCYIPIENVLYIRNISSYLYFSFIHGHASLTKLFFQLVCIKNARLYIYDKA